MGGVLSTFGVGIMSTDSRCCVETVSDSCPVGVLSPCRYYLPIIKDCKLYPVLKDSNGVVLSLPPIINGNLSKINLKTKNVLIECTGTDLTKARIVLDTLVCMFSQYCKEPFTVEMCAVKTSSGKVKKYQNLKNRQMAVTAKKINERIGSNLSAESIAQLLPKMGLSASVKNEKLLVQIPPTRHDILQACDVCDDVGIAFGYDKFAELARPLPASCTVGVPDPINELTDKLRNEAAQCGFTEPLSFILCSQEDVGEKLRYSPSGSSAVTIANSKMKEFQVTRTTLLPGMLYTISANRSMAPPLKIFEVSCIVLKDATAKVGARNERRMCAVYYDKQPSYAKLHGLLDEVMKMLGVPFQKEGGNCGYHLKKIEDPMYHQASEIICEGTRIGVMGSVHPEVLTNFELNWPCSAFEFNIEHFLPQEYKDRRKSFEDDLDRFELRHKQL